MAPTSPYHAPLHSHDRAIGGGLVSTSAMCAREKGGDSGGTARDKKQAAQPETFLGKGCSLRRRDLLGQLHMALWRVGQAVHTGSSKALGVVRKVATEGMPLQ